MLCACVTDAGGYVAAVGGRTSRHALAAAFGARPADPHDADVVIEAAGTPEARRDALELVQPGGTVLLVGSTEPGRADRGRRGADPPRGAASSAGRPGHAPRHVRAALAFLASGAYPVGAAGHARGRARRRRLAARRPARRLPQGRRPAVSERVLTVRELNRALLARQLLLERARLPVTRALERVGPLHAQGVESTYVNLWSRIEGFRREQLTRALERRAVVRGSLLRGTRSTSSQRTRASDLSGALCGTRGSHGWPAPGSTATRRVGAPTGRAVARKETGGAAAVRRAVEAALGGDRYLAMALGMRLGLLTVAAGRGLGLSRRLAGTRWRNAVARDDCRPNRAEAIRHLVRRYLAAFGPATVDDLCFWASLRKANGRPVRSTSSSCAASATRRAASSSICRARRCPRPTRPPRPASCCAGTTSTSATRRASATASCRPAFRRHVYTVNTVMPATFLVDGFVAGTWRYERGRIELEPWRRLTKAERAELADEAERLAAFMA